MVKTALVGPLRVSNKEKEGNTTTIEKFKADNIVVLPSDCEDDMEKLVNKFGIIPMSTDSEGLKEAFEKLGMTISLKSGAKSYTLDKCLIGTFFKKSDEIFRELKKMGYTVIGDNHGP